MSDTNLSPSSSRQNAFKEILRRLPANLLNYGSSLGLIVLASGLRLPVGLEAVANSVGGGIFSNMITDILKKKNLTDEEIRKRTEDAIRKSDIANLLTKQEFNQEISLLIQQLSTIENGVQDILNEQLIGFSMVEGKFDEHNKHLDQPVQMETRKARIFISYNPNEEVQFVERLYNDLKDDFDVWWDHETVNYPSNTIRGEIDAADRLLIVAGAYTFTSDAVRNQWQYAYDNLKGINVALYSGDYPKIEANLPEVLRDFSILDFRTGNDYDEQLSRLKSQLAKPATPVGRLIHVPTPPKHYLPFSDAINTLLDLIVIDSHKLAQISTEKHTTIIEGMGGTGKSVLAAVFARERDVRLAFPDGIIWLTDGHQQHQSNRLDLYRQICDALGMNPSFLNETIAYQKVQRALADKKCLLILDDVWDLSIGRTLCNLVSDTQAHLLITTRHLHIKDINANEYHLELIDKSMAVNYLRSWVGDDPDLGTVADYLGCLFLALNLAGVRMKEGNLSGADYLKSFDRVSHMKISSDPTDRYSSLEVSIRIGLEAAFADVKDEELLYYTLGIFPEHAAIPQQTVTRLWACIYPDADENKLTALLDNLVDFFLVERSKDKKITLHDLLLKFAREQLGDRYTETHRNLIEAYRKTLTGSDWHSLVDDGYIFNHLIYHLENAGCQSEIHNLFRQQEWLKKRSAIELITDFEKARSLVSIEQDTATYFRYVLFAEVIAQRYQQFPVEALPTVIDRGWANPETLMTAINNMFGKHEAKVRAYIKMAATISPELQRGFSREILLIAQDVSEYDENHCLQKITLLQDLTPFLYGDARSSALQMMWKLTFEVKERKKRKDLLAWLFEHISEDQLESLKEDMLKIDSIYHRTNIITRTADKFPSSTQLELWKSVYEDLIDEKVTGYSAAEALGYILPRLPKKLQHRCSSRILKELKSIGFWESHEFFTEIFDPLLPYIPVNDIRELWERAKFEAEHHEAYWGEQCLISIALCVPYENIPLDLDFDNEMQDSKYCEDTRACIKLAMINRLNPDQEIKAALEAWTTLIYKAGRYNSEDIMLRAAAKLSQEAAAAAWKITIAIEAKQEEDGETKRRLYHRKTDALVGLAYRIPTDIILSACIECLPQHTRETLAGRPEVGWIQVIRALTGRLDKVGFSVTEIDAVWNRLFTTLIEDPSDEYSLNMRATFYLIPLMPERLQQHYWELARKAVQRIPWVKTHVYALCGALEPAPASMKSQLWKDAQELAIGVQDTFLLRTVVDSFAIVSKYLSPEHTSEIIHSDWQNGVFARALIEEGPKLDSSRYWGNSESYALLLLLAPPDYLSKVWSVIKSSKSSDNYEGSVCLSIVLFPFVPEADQKILLKNILRNGWIDEDERIDRLKPLFGKWTEEDVWNAWQYMQKNFTEDYSEWHGSNWAKFLTPLLAEKYTTHAWNLALQCIFPSHWVVWPEVCEQLATQLPVTFLPTAWRQIEEFEHQEGYWSYGRALKAAMSPRLPDEFLLSLSQRVNLPDTLPMDIFTCSMAKYIQYGTLWFGNNNTNLPGDIPTDLFLKVIETEAKISKGILYLLSYLCYLTVPISFILLIILQPFKWLRSQIAAKIKSTEVGLSKKDGKLKFYIQAGILIILYIPKGILSRFRYFIGRILGPIIQGDSRIIKTLYLVELILFRNNIAWKYLHYTFSRKERFSQLEKVTNVAQLAAQRPILQIIGGRKLRKHITDSYIDAQTWWKDAVTWIES